MELPQKLRRVESHCYYNFISLFQPTQTQLRQNTTQDSGFDNSDSGRFCNEENDVSQLQDSGILVDFSNVQVNNINITQIVEIPDKNSERRKKRESKYSESPDCRVYSDHLFLRFLLKIYGFGYGSVPKNSVLKNSVRDISVPTVQSESIQSKTIQS